MAAICQLQLRVTDIFARYGGEEFICLLYGVTQDQALETAERIRSSIENTLLNFENTPISITASLGVAFAEPDQTLENVIDNADRALYQSKTGGRNRITLWMPEN